ncbi:50S ribosomal protein L15 [Halopseudomonas salegens]|uniref:Large ribosomal subunit protein uL15 n=1 Tax=Halopseudomonas salegens TaxID=1434072 RepID=A0A1H2H5D7_9GAMM|nr:50S ribosomal protein L15 [Halopseudomonas salegens]MCL5043197.1 50S ribosomal protein L15 [Gammaproteobacteria bacterium]SDU27034.1 LSU ribosomal protein L15P [Halopseudomonas salegens]
MKLNDLRSAPGARRNKLRVGRGIGSGLGKTAGRGHKGLTSRSGGTVAPGFEGGQQPLHRRLPKFGFTSKLAAVTAEIRTSELNAVDADVIDLQALKDADIISNNYLRAKVVLSGDVSKAVTLKGIRVTKGARAAIEAAGGKIEE